MIQSFTVRIFGGIAFACLSLSPALAMSAQSGPTGTGGQVKLVDPDEQFENLADQARRSARQQSYDPGSAVSVMRYGNGAGSGVRTPRISVQGRPFGH